MTSRVNNANKDVVSWILPSSSKGKLELKVGDVVLKSMSCKKMEDGNAKATWFESRVGLKRISIKGSDNKDVVVRVWASEVGEFAKSDMELQANFAKSYGNSLIRFLGDSHQNRIEEVFNKAYNLPNGKVINLHLKDPENVFLLGRDLGGTLKGLKISGSLLEGKDFISSESGFFGGVDFDGKSQRWDVAGGEWNFEGLNNGEKI